MTSNEINKLHLLYKQQNIEGKLCFYFIGLENRFNMSELIFARIIERAEREYRSSAFKLCKEEISTLRHKKLFAIVGNYINWSETTEGDAFWVYFYNVFRGVTSTYVNDYFIMLHKSSLKINTMHSVVKSIENPFTEILSKENA